MILERKNVDDSDSISLCFWALFQAVGLTCVTAIICRTIIYRNGYFETNPENNTTSITKSQFSNWHYTLTTVGFIYLYANCKYNMNIQYSFEAMQYVNFFITLINPKTNIGEQ
jgi:ferric iron reductase protein FhuF